MSPDREYAAHLAQGRFMIQRSASTGAYVFYPRVAAPGTGATDLEWVPASGYATVYATTVIRKKPPEKDFNVCLVRLDEGPQMMTRVEQIEPENVKVGMRVKARISEMADGQHIVVFDAA